MTQAHDYARRIADELRGLDMTADELLTLDPDEFKSMTRTYCDDLGIDNHHTAHDVGMHWLENDTLDVWADVEWRHNHSTVRSVTALRTAGGPRCEVSWDGNHDNILTVTVWWGSDESTVRVECSTVADAMAIVWDNAREAVAR